MVDFIKYYKLPLFLSFLFGLLLTFKECRADDYIDVSLGLYKNAIPKASNVKLIQLGHRDYIALGLFTQYEAGGWFQLDEGDGRKSSAYGAGQLGIEANGFLIARVAIGPALITTPDSYLGGIFQFTTDIFIGIKGDNENTLGFKYKHFSSAGLEMPNEGRDFGGLELTVPW